MKSLFLKTILFAGALAGAAATPVFAQSQSLQVKVPFAFVVDNQKMAAGDYTISEAGESGILLIQSRDSKQAATVISVAGAAPSAKGEPSLVFERHGANVYLVRILMSNEASRDLPSHLGNSAASFR